MFKLPKRQTLASQATDILREEIARGTWTDKLPSERLLCEKLQVSRNTLRAALERLRKEQLLRVEHAKGHWILPRAIRTVPVARSRDVGLITSETLDSMRPNQALWIDELRALLAEHGNRLHVFHGTAYFRTKPGPALEQLLKQNPHGCWILMRSAASTQAWFSRLELPCIVAGSVHAGLKLAFRDLDHRAVCRHAAGELIRLGHRQIALITSNLSMAGDLESENGLLEAVRQHSDQGIEARMCHHDGTVTDLCLAVRRLLKRKRPPTALVVANPYHYLRVMCLLAQMGLRVPEDITMISRDDDLFLSYMDPTPTRYVTNPHDMAKSILLPVLELLACGKATVPELKLIPDFVRGGSLGQAVIK